MLRGADGAAWPEFALVAIAAPLIASGLAVVAAQTRARAVTRGLVALSAAPALVAAVALPAGTGEARWLFLGAEFGLDAVGRAFVAVTGAVWLVSGVYALGYLRGKHSSTGFMAAYGLALTGAVGLPFAADVVSFYALFVIMTVSSYALVVYERGPRAMRAGRVYMVMAIGGDLLVFAGVVWTVYEAGAIHLAAAPAAVADAPGSAWLSALLFFGFGVKAGAAGLHMWLPLAHPAAPTPASAVLSGAVIKAGLLGWLRFLPLGEAPALELGLWAAVSGAGIAYLAAAIGATQRDTKTVLAYSSVSQMGLATAALGVVLLAPGRAGAGALAVAVFAVHHGLAKLVLFLGVGAVRAPAGRAARAVATGTMVFAAAALAGFPLTSGAVAKKALGDVLPPDQGLGFWLLGEAITLSSAATVVLLAALFVRLRGEAGPAGGATPRSSRVMLCALVAAAALLAGSVALLPGVGLQALLRESLAIASLWGSLWPILIGALAAWAGLWAFRGRGGLLVPAGDALIVIEPLAYRGRALGRAALSRLAAASAAASARRAAVASAARVRLSRLLASEGRVFHLAIGLLAAAWAVIALAALARGG